MEYPATFCDGTLYVNNAKGTTFAIDAETGDLVWRRKVASLMASSPAIAGPRLVVSSHDGTVTGLNRANGKVLWRVGTGGRVESSPVAVDNTAYFGSTDGRLFAVNVTSGAVRWAYDTGGRINSSPSIWGNRVCITTYAGSVVCLRRSDGNELWTTYVKRDLLRYESFYASASTDGQRLYTTSRAGKIVALNARSGSIVWTYSMGSLGYATPAIADGRIFVGGFDQPAAGFPRDQRARAVVDERRRQGPLTRARRRESRLRLDAQRQDARAPRRRREDRLAAQARRVCAGNRHRPALLLLPQRVPRRLQGQVQPPETRPGVDGGATRGASA